MVPVDRSTPAEIAGNMVWWNFFFVPHSLKHATRIGNTKAVMAATIPNNPKLPERFPRKSETDIPQLHASMATAMTRFWEKFINAKAVASLLTVRVARKKKNEMD